MAKTKSASRLVNKLKYYRKLADNPVDVYYGWAGRDRNNETGGHPAHYMKLHEFGTRRHPPRRFMFLTIQRDGKKWKKLVAVALQDSTPTQIIATNLGIQIVSDIQKTLRMNLPPENSPKTAKRKLKNKRLPRTLMDTQYAYSQVKFSIGKTFSGKRAKRRNK